jgi:hypothetical protein
MTPQDLSNALTERFADAVQQLAPNSFQIETPAFRLLVLLSEDRSWVRALLPIAPVQDAMPFVEELLEANFDLTQETRYAFQQGVLWVVFQHSLQGLALTDFQAALDRLLILKQQGIDALFERLIEKRIRQIVQLSKRQGQSLEATLQTLERFYQEGLMGDLEMSSQSRSNTMEAWRRQLERLWNEVEE